MDELPTTKNVSPLRYPGGKTRACKIIDHILSSHFDTSKIQTIISPFFGGGSFEFYLQNKYSIKIIANDKFYPLFNFWRKCQTNKNELCTKLRESPTVSKQEFTDYRHLILSDSLDDFTKAVYYFIINRCSFSGATLSGGFSEEASKKRYTESSIKKIEDLNLNNIEFNNLDFVEFFEKNETTSISLVQTQLAFIDPPYYLEKKSKLYGKNGDLHESFDHMSLFTILTQSSTRQWILTYNNCPYIRELYKKYTILDAAWSYGMNASKESSEIIILSILLDGAPN